MRILFASSEVEPFAKTGGLADVSSSLPRALAALGHEVSIFMPKYRQVDPTRFSLSPIGTQIKVPLGDKVVAADIWQSDWFSPVKVYFIGNENFFNRQHLYDERGVDYPDNAERFFFFCKAILEYLIRTDQTFDICHCNDWQTGLIPIYLKTLYRDTRQFQRMKSLMTVHNLGYQGIFDSSLYHLTNLSWDYFTPAYLEYYGRLNLLKGGIVFADWVNTVSPRYAMEITSEQFGFGLHGVLAQRRDRLSGILNGIDPQIWNPKTDRFLASTFSPEEMAGKAVCKQQLQKELGLKENPRTPIIGLIGRLTEQKGFDLVAQLIDQLMTLDLQLAILGTGDQRFHNMLQLLGQKYPQKLSLRIAFDEALAHRIEAGSDFFLIPSRYEPCGLNQLYSLRYGTLPIVRGVGGLDDTVIDLQENPAQGTGFKFYPFEAKALMQKILQALDLYQNRPQLDTIRRRGMFLDFSWTNSAQQYVKLYQSL